MIILGIGMPGEAGALGLRGAPGLNGQKGTKGEKGDTLTADMIDKLKDEIITYMSAEHEDNIKFLTQVIENKKKIEEVVKKINEIEEKIEAAF